MTTTSSLYYIVIVLASVIARDGSQGHSLPQTRGAQASSHWETNRKLFEDLVSPASDNHHSITSPPPPPRYHHHKRSSVAIKHQRRNKPHHHKRSNSKTHSKSVKRHASYLSLFGDMKRNHGSFNIPFSDMYQYHHSAPHFLHLKHLQNQHNIMMNRLHSQIDDHMMRMRERISPIHYQQNYQHRFQSPQHHQQNHHKHHQYRPQERPNHYQHQPQRHHNHRHHPQHLSRFQHHHSNRVPQSSSPPSQIRQHERSNKHTVGRKQFKIFRSQAEDMPGDVEVFSGPRPLAPSNNTTPTSRTDNNPNRGYRKNCTTPVSRGQGVFEHPFHHTIIKTTASSHGRSNFKPNTPQQPHSQFFTPIFPGVPTPTSNHPIHGNTALVTGLSRPSTPLLNHVQHHSSGDHQESVQVSVEDHLDPLSSVNQGLGRPQEGDIACIKCPPDAHVEAPRGKDCVYAHFPSPLSCTPRWGEVRTVVTEGPTPGTRLQEGRYAMVITVVAGDALSSIPITSCRFNYNVQVRKCGELPRGGGLEVFCTAGRAWGSRCSWRCINGLTLQGSSSTTCTGHRHPHWSHPPPACTEPTSPAPSGRRGCNPPPEVPRGHYVCETSTGSSRRISIPKDAPAITRDTTHVALVSHLEGIVCTLHCDPGRVVGVSHRGRSKLTCAPGGHWDHRPPPCRRQVTPVLKAGECEDHSLTFPHSPLSFLPLPTFTTASGVPAHVTCLLEGTSHGLYTRTCTARDPELETSTICKYRIIVNGGNLDPDADILPSTFGKQHHPSHSREDEGRGLHTENDVDGALTLNMDEKSIVQEIHQDFGDNEGTIDGNNGKEDQSRIYNERGDSDVEYVNKEFDYYYDASDDDYNDYSIKYDNSSVRMPELRVDVNKLTISPLADVFGNAIHNNRADTVEKVRNTDDRNFTDDNGEDTRSHSLKINSQVNTNRIEIESDSHFTLVDSMPKVMEEDMSDLFPLFREHPDGDIGVHSKKGHSRGRTKEQQEKEVRKQTVNDVHNETETRKIYSVGEAVSTNTSPEVAVDGDEIGKEDEKKLESSVKEPGDITKAKEEVKDNQALTESVIKLDETKQINPGDSGVIELQPSTFPSVVREENYKRMVEIEENSRKRETMEEDSNAGVLEEDNEEESQAAMMEAMLTMKVLMEDCGATVEVEQVVQEALLGQVTCNGLTCHHPHATCTHTSAGGGSVSVVWAVGGLYEAVGDYYYDDHHVPEVETAIAAVLESTQEVLRSPSFTRSLEALGATLDLSSFNLTQLDLLCRQLGHGLNPNTNRCSLCVAGTYSRDGSCVPCLAGTYMDQAGRSTCVPCKEGSHAPRPGMTHCLSSTVPEHDPGALSPSRADHEVEKVRDPHVVQYVLGPSMEVSQGRKRQAPYPSYKGCYSCTLGGLGSSSYGSSSSYSSGSYGGMDSLGMMGPVDVPHTSSRQEVRSQQQFVNGQPVYELHHERRFQDGQLVHDQKTEKDENDLGFSPQPVSGYSGSQVSSSGSSYTKSGASRYTQPGYGDELEGSYVQSQSLGSTGYGSDDAPHDSSSDFNSEMARMREQLRRQMMSYGSRQPAYHRSEVHSQARYVNGRPVYVKNVERKYKDGQLVHNRTEEKGPDDLGTRNIVGEHNSAGPVGDSHSGGYYEHRQEHQEHSSISSRDNQNTYPRYRPGYSSESQGRHQYSSYPSYRPSSSTQYTQETRDSSTSYRPSYDSSSRRYSEDSRASSSPTSYPSHRQTYGSSSTQYSGESESRETAPSSPYRPTSGVSYTSHQPVPGSSTQYTEQSRESSSSHSYPSYSSGSSLTQYSGDSRETSSSSPPYRPTSGSSTQYTEQSRDSSSSHSYPSYSSGSSLTQHSEDSRETSPSSPSYRPTPGRSHTSYTPPSGYSPRNTGDSPNPRPASGRSSTRYTEESQETSTSYPYRLASGSSESRQPSPSYPSNRQSSGSSSSHYSEDSRESTSSHMDVSQTRRISGHRGSKASPDDLGDLERTLVQQSARNPNPGQSITQITQERSESSHRESGGYRQPYRPSPTGGYSHMQSEISDERNSAYDSRRAETSRSSSPRLPHTSGSRDRAHTVTFDLSSSDSEASLTDQLLGTSHGGRRHDTQEEEHHSSLYESQHSDDDSIHSYGQQQQVGIPGAIIGPVSSDDDGDDDNNKERYDISPHEDGYVYEIPSVDNEMDSAFLPRVDIEVDSSDFSQDYEDDSYNSRVDESSDLFHTRADESSGLYNSHDDGLSGHDQRGPYSGYSSSSRYYNSTHTRQGDLIGQATPSVSHTRYDNSRASVADETRNTYPGSVGSSYHHYNESRRHSSVVRDQQPLEPLAGSLSGSSSTACTESEGCVIVGSPLIGSQRSEIRTTKKYLNGRLVGVTHHERQYENGELIHENNTDHGGDELIGMDLSAYGDDQLELMQGSYHPGSYSQQHEVKQEKKFVNGEQVYDLHHERRFEDGHLVHENRTEKDEDDFGVGRLSEGRLGVSYLDNQVASDSRHEVTQSQHLQQQVTSGRVAGGGVGRSTQTHQVSGTGRVSVVPQYTRRRYETRRQQEYVDGLPVYDLHHERRFHNGSLVYENRTELDEKALGGAGNYDALHQILAGNTLNTPSQSSYNRNADSSRVGAYGSHGELQETSQSAESYGGSTVSQTRESHSSSTAHDGSLGTYGGSGSISGSTSASEESSTRRNGATTIVLGGSGSSLTGSDSIRSGSSAYERGGSSSSSTYGSESYRGSSQQHSPGRTRPSGCLTCVLLGGSGYSSQDSSHRASHGYPGVVDGGYSERREINAEEHYEDGQLVHGYEESRRFQDGQLVQENKRQYSDVPAQVSYPAALESAGTSYVTPASVSSSHTSGTSVNVTVEENTTDVCQPNPCHYGGTCLAGLHGPICACNFGFKGPVCAELGCPKGFCRRGGKCNIEDGVHVCSCRSGYSGHRCEERTQRHWKKHARRHASKP
ncbi:uncharacterized protein LOC121875732 isoform X1 [Homarus americanus]|uniref:uncharacterized protein LOC121875732 isoform X1 n=1 Tax=Homarus americanus TaxID=6706 RepID=UPI001C4940FF|nr:uncharacterized protein LOC121875732 isoform X1 [Homarus americanus]